MSSASSSSLSSRTSSCHERVSVEFKHRKTLFWTLYLGTRSNVKGCYLSTIILWSVFLASTTTIAAAAAAAAAASSYLYGNDVEASKYVHEYMVEQKQAQELPSFLSSTKPRVVQFYNSFCGHCHQYKPTYIEYAKELTPVGVEFYAVSCVAHNNICRSFGLQGVPSLLVLPNELPKFSIDPTSKLLQVPVSLNLKPQMAVTLKLETIEDKLGFNAVKRSLTEEGSDVGEADSEEDESDSEDGDDHDRAIGSEESEEDDDDDYDQQESLGNEDGDEGSLDDGHGGNGKLDEESESREDDDDNDDGGKEVQRQVGDDMYQNRPQYMGTELDDSSSTSSDEADTDDTNKNLLSQSSSSGSSLSLKALAATKVIRKTAGASLARQEPRDMDKYKEIVKKHLVERDRTRNRLFNRNKIAHPTPVQVFPGATQTMKANRPGTYEFSIRKQELQRAMEFMKRKRRGIHLHKLAADPNRMGRLPFKVAVTKPHMGERVPIVRRIYHMSPEEQLILDASLSFLKSLEYGVYRTHGALPAARKKALKDWLDLVSIALPPEWGLIEVVSDLNNNIDYISISSLNFDTILKAHPTPRSTWSANCYGRNPLSCGFWKLLHVITVGLAENRGGLNLIASGLVADQTRTFSPLEAADTIREYMQYFFHCTECATNFLEHYDDCSRNRRCDRLSNEKETASDEDWMETAKWLWEVHNDISIRLLHERKARAMSKRAHHETSSSLTMDDDIQALWPTLHYCVTCFNADGTWNEDAVFLHLEKTYWPGFELEKDSRMLVWYGDEDTAGWGLTLFLLLAGIVLSFYMRHSLTTEHFHRTVLMAKNLRRTGLSKARLN